MKHLLGFDYVLGICTIVGGLELNMISFLSLTCHSLMKEIGKEIQTYNEMCTC